MFNKLLDVLIKDKNYLILKNKKIPIGTNKYSFNLGRIKQLDDDILRVKTLINLIQKEDKK